MEDQIIAEVNALLAAVSDVRVQGPVIPRELRGFPKIRRELRLTIAETPVLQVLAASYGDSVTEDTLRKLLPDSEPFAVVSSLGEKLGERARVVIEPGAFTLSVAEVNLLVWAAGRVAVMLPAGRVFVAGESARLTPMPPAPLGVLAAVVSRGGRTAILGELAEETGRSRRGVQQAVVRARAALGRDRDVLRTYVGVGWWLDAPPEIASVVDLAIDPEERRYWFQGSASSTRASRRQGPHPDRSRGTSRRVARGDRECPTGDPSGA